MTVDKVGQDTPIKNPGYANDVVPFNFVPSCAISMIAKISESDSMSGTETSRKSVERERRGTSGLHGRDRKRLSRSGSSACMEREVAERRSD